MISRDLTEHVLASEALREAHAALVHVTRVTTLGGVTASFAHELNEPRADIVSDAERASTIIERVRGLARRSSPGKVTDSTRGRRARRRHLARGRIGRPLRGDSHPRRRRPPVVLGDRVQLQQLLLNLVVNGTGATSTVDEPERRLEIRGRPDSQDDRSAARISVQDREIGLHAGQAERNPFRLASRCRGSYARNPFAAAIPNMKPGRWPQ